MGKQIERGSHRTRSSLPKKKSKKTLSLAQHYVGDPIDTLDDADPSTPRTEFRKISRAYIRRSRVDSELPIREEVDAAFRKAVRNDFGAMLQGSGMAVTAHVAKHLRLQAIVGHAASGHGQFYNVARYPNCTLDDIYDALGEDAKILREQRENLLHNLRWWIKIATNDPKSDKAKRLVDWNGNPLMGLSKYAGRTVDPFEVFAGISLATKQDNYEWRTRVRERFGIEMGGGINVAVNIEKLKEYNLTLEVLATNPHEEAEIKRYAKLGIISMRKKTPITKGIVNGYIRRVRGHGVSDNGGALSSGFNFGPDAMPGFHLGDAADTIDKDLPFVLRGGSDEDIGNDLEERCHAKGIRLPSRKQIEEAIYLASIDPTRTTHYPDCSLRRFTLETTVRGNPTCALEHHEQLVNSYCRGSSHHKLPKIYLGFAGVSSKAFYDAFTSRMERLIAEGHIAPAYLLNMRK